MRLLLKDVRLAFPILWEPEPFPGGKDPTKYFSANFILPPTHSQLPELNKICEALAREQWKDKGPAILKAIKQTGKIFLKSGDTKPEYDGFEGNWFVSARTKTRPNYFDQHKNEIGSADAMLYAGCYCNVSLEFYSYTKGNNGLGAAIRGVQHLRDGDAFGGGRPADADEFDDIGVTDDLTS